MIILLIIIMIITDNTLLSQLAFSCIDEDDLSTHLRDLFQEIINNVNINIIIFVMVVIIVIMIWIRI